MIHVASAASKISFPSGFTTAACFKSWSDVAIYNEATMRCLPVWGIIYILRIRGMKFSLSMLNIPSPIQPDFPFQQIDYKILYSPIQPILPQIRPLSSFQSFPHLLQVYYELPLLQHSELVHKTEKFLMKKFWYVAYCLPPPLLRNF